MPESWDEGTEAAEGNLRAGRGRKQGAMVTSWEVEVGSCCLENCGRHSSGFIWWVPGMISGLKRKLALRILVLWSSQQLGFALPGSPL